MTYGSACERGLLVRYSECGPPQARSARLADRLGSLVADDREEADKELSPTGWIGGPISAGTDC
jgi:hypothetical protein